jgi:hypothetical protein
MKYIATNCFKAIATTLVIVLLATYRRNPASKIQTKPNTGPPPGFVVRATKKDRYTHVPEISQRTFYIPPNDDFRLPVIRALRSLGWKMATDKFTAQLIWEKFETKKRYAVLLPWQRYNHIPGFQSWDRKDLFAKGFQDYRTRNPEKKLYFLPETYTLGTEDGQLAFEERLQLGGLKQPWVLKVRQAMQQLHVFFVQTCSSLTSLGSEYQ